MALNPKKTSERFYSSAEYDVLPPAKETEVQYGGHTRTDSGSSSPGPEQKPSAQKTTDASQPGFVLTNFRASSYDDERTSYKPIVTTRHVESHSWGFGASFSRLLSMQWTLLCAILRFLTATFQLSLVTYLALAYISLPRDNSGHLPIIPGLYASTPFISCIGGMHLSTYRGLVTISATFMLTVDSVLLYRKYTNPVAYWIRRITWLSSVLTFCFAVWLSVAINIPSTHKHLTLIALHSLAVLTYKVTGLITDHLMRRAFPLLRTDPTALFIRQWKEATVLFATPLATLLTVGIFSCHANEMDASVMTPGTTCYRVLSIAAQADWLYAVVIVNWSLLMGFEVWADTHITMVVAKSRMQAMLEQPVAARYGHDAIDETTELQKVELEDKKVEERDDSIDEDEDLGDLGTKLTAAISNTLGRDDHLPVSLRAGVPGSS